MSATLCLRERLQAALKNGAQRAKKGAKEARSPVMSLSEDSRGSPIRLKKLLGHFRPIAASLRSAVVRAPCSDYSATRFHLLVRNTRRA